jgi:Ras family protein Q
LVSVEQRVTDLEYCCTNFESSVVQSGNLDPKCENFDSTRLLENMHADFETTMSKLQSVLQQAVRNQKNLGLIDCKTSKAECSSASSSNVACEQSDVDNLTGLKSMAVDRREVLSTLVLNIGHENKKLAEFVRLLSECTASADYFIELKAVVECMARVTGVSEHKAEQLITEFIDNKGVELEHLKREQRLIDDKIRELQLAKDQMATLHDLVYHNQLPYLNVITETMQRECDRYKHDLNVMANKLSERVNAKVAQAMQQSLANKHQHNDKAQFGLPSIADEDTKPGPSVATRSSGEISTEMLQPVVDNDSQVLGSTTTAEFKRHQDTHSEVRDTAVNSPSPFVKMQAASGPKNTHFQRQDQFLNSSKPLDVVKSVLRSKSPFKQVAELLSLPQVTTTTTSTQHQQQKNCLDYATMLQSKLGHWPVIKCVVMGHESAQTHRLIGTYATKKKTIVTRTLDGVSMNALVLVRIGTVYNFRLANCTEATKLREIIDCDVIVICFSVIDKVSYQDAQNVWLKQIKEVFPEIPYLLVGTQIDQRQITDIRHFQVECEQGLQLSKDIGAVAYFECSDLDVDGVETMFEYAAHHFIEYRT